MIERDDELVVDGGGGGGDRWLWSLIGGRETTVGRWGSMSSRNCGQ